MHLIFKNPHQVVSKTIIFTKILPKLFRILALCTESLAGLNELVHRSRQLSCSELMVDHSNVLGKDFDHRIFTEAES